MNMERVLLKRDASRSGPKWFGRVKLLSVRETRGSSTSEHGHHHFTLITDISQPPHAQPAGNLNLSSIINSEQDHRAPPRTWRPLSPRTVATRRRSASMASCSTRPRCSMLGLWTLATGKARTNTKCITRDGRIRTCHLSHCSIFSPVEWPSEVSLPGKNLSSPHPLRCTAAYCPVAATFSASITRIQSRTPSLLRWRPESN